MTKFLEIGGIRLTPYLSPDCDPSTALPSAQHATSSIAGRARARQVVIADAGSCKTPIEDSIPSVASESPTGNTRPCEAFVALKAAQQLREAGPAGEMDGPH